MREQTIIVSQQNGHLHINLNGHFTAETALQLSNAIARNYFGEGRIFIHTGKIASISPQSRRTFSDMIDILDLPPEKMYLTGSPGLKIGPDKSRVIVYGKANSGCAGGGCDDCTCHDRNEPE
nr:hypothetical protein [uncultured Desulfobulbus sp.]